jgi:hypothetical protein
MRLQVTQPSCLMVIECQMRVGFASWAANLFEAFMSSVYHQDAL